MIANAFFLLASLSGAAYAEVSQSSGLFLLLSSRGGVVCCCVANWFSRIRCYRDSGAAAWRALLYWHVSATSLIETVADRLQHVCVAAVSRLSSTVR